MSLRKFIANKPFYKYALSLAIPIMFQQLITSSVNLVDNLMVGQLGDASLAGVAAVNRLYMIALFAIFGFMATSTIFIAQYYGAKDESHIKQSFRFGLLAAFTTAVIFFTIANLFPVQCVSFFTNDPVIIAQGLEYIRYVAWTLLPLSLCVVFGDAIRALGDVKTPMLASIVAIIINCVFNYLLIFGKFGFPMMGVAGAGLATLLARIVEFLILFIKILVNDYPFKTKLADIFKIEGKIAKRIFLKGLPLTSNEILWSLGMATLFKFYSTRGAEVMSGYAISGTVADLFFTLFSGMAATTTVIIAHQLGANKLKEAKADAYHLLGMAVGLAVVLGFLMFGASFVIPSLYKVSNEALYTAQSFLRIQSALFWVYMMSTQSYFILRAGGDTKAVLMLDAGYMWFINIPIVGLAAYFTNFNIVQLYLCGQSTDLIKMIIAYGLVDRGHWIKNLTHNEEVVL